MHLIVHCPPRISFRSSQMFSFNQLINFKLTREFLLLYSFVGAFTFQTNWNGEQFAYIGEFPVFDHEVNIIYAKTLPFAVYFILLPPPPPV